MASGEKKKKRKKDSVRVKTFHVEFHEDSDDPALEEQIRNLVKSEMFAVLCVQGESQPYGSVVAYAVSHDLESIAFGTPIASRKYQLLSMCDRVAVVIDNRGRYPDDMAKIEAVTATGRATRFSTGADRDRLIHMLNARHPNLKSFIEAPSTALFRIDIKRYLHVHRFLEARRWFPNTKG
jgi:nitroimidazol reductase NimA-like FMN-containing flavoprotein (pyridoxamine 5'-phosphate oxidase superfamily)